MEGNGDTNSIALQYKKESQPLKTESQPSGNFQLQEQKEVKAVESTVNTSNNQNEPLGTKEYADLLLKLRSSDSGDSLVNKENSLSNSPNTSKKSNTIQNLQDTARLNLLCNAALSPKLKTSSVDTVFANSNTGKEIQSINRSIQSNFEERPRSAAVANNYYAYPLISPKVEGNDSFQYSSINYDNIVNCNEVALSPEFFLYLLQHTDGDHLRNYLDKPHLRLASPNQGQITMSTVLHPEELVAEGVHASLRQLQIIYYLKNRQNIRSQLQAQAQIQSSFQSQEYHSYKSAESVSNRIVISRKRIDPMTQQGGSTNNYYPDHMKRVNTQDDMNRTIAKGN